MKDTPIDMHLPWTLEWNANVPGGGGFYLVNALGEKRATLTGTVAQRKATAELLVAAIDAWPRVVALVDAHWRVHASRGDDLAALDSAQLNTRALAKIVEANR
jgi:hypothetical protein